MDVTKTLFIFAVIYFTCQAFHSRKCLFLFFFFTFYLCLAQFTKNIFNPMGLIIIPQISLNVWTEVHVEHKSTCSSGDAEGMSLLSRGH